MKTCPVCKAGAFDDAEVCYGCLHPFGDEGKRSVASPAGKLPGQGSGGSMPGQMRPARLPEGGQRIVADSSVNVAARGADIVVRIEVVDASAARGALDEEAACRILRRSRPIQVTANARPAEAQRGALAGQRAQDAQSCGPRHAPAGSAVAGGGPQRSMQAVGA